VPAVGAHAGNAQQLAKLVLMTAAVRVEVFFKAWHGDKRRRLAALEFRL